MNKRHLPSDKEQKIAADILCAFMFCENMQQFHSTYDYLYKQYRLCDDPFTHTPCSIKEYNESLKEYEVQSMIERYGYFD